MWVHTWASVAHVSLGSLDSVRVEVDHCTAALAVVCVHDDVKADALLQTSDIEPRLLGCQVSHQLSLLRSKHLDHELLLQTAVKPGLTLDLQRVERLVRYWAVVQTVRLAWNITQHVCQTIIYNEKLSWPYELHYGFRYIIILLTFTKLVLTRMHKRDASHSKPNNAAYHLKQCFHKHFLNGLLYRIFLFIHRFS